MLKHMQWSALLLTLALLAGCSDQQAPTASSQTAAPSAPASAAETSAASQGAPAMPQPPEQSSMPTASASQQIDQDTALSAALENAGVPEEDAYNMKVERDSDNGVPIYDIEFETSYGDYDYEIALDDGRILGADYEVKEEALPSLGGSPVDLSGATALVQERIPGIAAEDIRIWEERDDGRTRFEGNASYGGIWYEFEIDPQTGLIFDWSADYRG